MCIEVRAADGLRVFFTIHPSGAVATPRQQPTAVLQVPHPAVDTRDVTTGLLRYRAVSLLGCAPVWYRTCDTRPDARHWRHTPDNELPLICR